MSAAATAAATESAASTYALFAEWPSGCGRYQLRAKPAIRSDGNQKYRRRDSEWCAAEWREKRSGPRVAVVILECDQSGEVGAHAAIVIEVSGEKAAKHQPLIRPVDPAAASVSLVSIDDIATQLQVSGYMNVRIERKGKRQQKE